MKDWRPLLAELRQGHAPAPEDLRSLAPAMADPAQLSSAQLGAIAMGLCRAKLTPEARVALTLGMRDSGRVLQWDLPGPVLDKHSTGGVGDCVSLILAPALAACGAFVPMVSGRGLGHTGGTLDKLEAIPGLRVSQDLDDLVRITGQVGCAIVSATAQIAPADARLYAVRDETATVESLDLITASILSKKLAAGLDGLVLDVKMGTGAFMETPAQAQALATALADTANGAGCATRAMITDMSQPLADAAGNALEVEAAMRSLTGETPESHLTRLVLVLGGALLHLGGLADNPKAGEAKVAEALQTGAAADRFDQMVTAQGGPSNFVANWPDRLPAAPVERPLWPTRGGQVAAINTRALGEEVIRLGGGRRLATDRIDPSVGLSRIARIGDHVGQDRPLLLIHARSEAQADAAEARLAQAFAIGEASVSAPPLVYAQQGGGAL